MKRSPSALYEQAAFAAHRLGDQEDGRAGQTQRRRVELDELHVHDLGAGAIAQRDAVGRGDGRVGADAVELAAAAGREHEVARR